MADHYYSKAPSAKSDRHTVETHIRGMAFRFVTDAGVFSKTGVDYGSRVLLEAITIAKDAKVLDVGCGYGPIGLTVARLVSQGQVTMIDINERAVELARHNAKLNGISNVSIMQSDLYEKVANEVYDTIISNPPIRAGKATVHRIFEEGYDRLAPGGSMWIVIQKKQGAPSAEAKLLSLFEQVDEVTKDKGYRIFRAFKAGQ